MALSTIPIDKTSLPWRQNEYLIEVLKIEDEYHQQNLPG